MRDVRPTREQYQTQDYVLGKCVLEKVVQWLECANYHIRRFPAYDENAELPFQEQANLKRCSKCKRVAYCGTECQKQHWSVGGHKRVCRAPGDLRVGDLVQIKGLSDFERGGYKQMFGEVARMIAPGRVDNGSDETMFIVRDPDFSDQACWEPKLVSDNSA
ncbi:hypothetical protein HDU76_010365 [Blyttiomyces sp. JEL0837]|nr:hypothetical protein HDU76_010365 [Blyttiomyces sp. JEL0837]